MLRARWTDSCRPTPPPPAPTGGGSVSRALRVAERAVVIAQPGGQRGPEALDLGKQRSTPRGDQGRDVRDAGGVEAEPAENARHRFVRLGAQVFIPDVETIGAGELCSVTGRSLDAHSHPAGQ